VWACLIYFASSCQGVRHRMLETYEGASHSYFRADAKRQTREQYSGNFSDRFQALAMAFLALHPTLEYRRRYSHASRLENRRPSSKTLLQSSAVIARDPTHHEVETSLHLPDLEDDQVLSTQGENASRTKHGRKFEAMFDHVAGYSEHQLSALKGERKRQLLRGVVSGARTPEVVAAFRILYEDYPPLRVGANFIFGWFDKTLEVDAENSEEDSPEENERGANPRNQKKLERIKSDFDDMMFAVREWETLTNERSGEPSMHDDRLALVLKGTFVGARTDGLVDALRILYEDHLLLRLGAKLIFRLLRSIAPKP